MATTLLCPGSPCGRCWTRQTHAEPNSAHNGLTACRMSLQIFSAGSGKHTPSPLRKSARTLCLPRTTGPRFALPGRQRWPGKHCRVSPCRRSPSRVPSRRLTSALRSSELAEHRSGHLSRLRTSAPLSVQSCRQIPPEIFRRWIPPSRHIALPRISQRFASAATLSQLPDRVADRDRLQGTRPRAGFFVTLAPNGT